MKLSESRICLDCEEVFEDNEHQACPKCASFATASLLLWIVPLVSVCAPVMMKKALKESGDVC
jgi:hypothetical protein